MTTHLNFPAVFVGTPEPVNHVLIGQTDLNLSRTNEHESMDTGNQGDP